MKNLIFAALSALALAQSPVSACGGLHGTMDNPFTTSYPGSLGVAIGTQQAVVSGQLVALPALDAEASSARFEARLEQLRVRLEKAGLKGGFALLVVDSGHWTRFAANGTSVRIAQHASPAIYDPVMLTSESALVALLDGRLAADVAERAGLVRWGGSESPTLVQTMLAALATGT